jgi:hypothetical protein
LFCRVDENRLVIVTMSHFVILGLGDWIQSMRQGYL